MTSDLMLWFRSGGRPTPAEPEIEIAIGPAISGWMVRVLAAGVSFGCVALLASDRTRWILGGLIVATVLARPAGGAPAVLALLTALWLMVGEPFAPQMFAVLALVHLVIVLSGLAGPLPWAGRMELSLFRRPMLRFLSIQVFAQILALAGRWLYLEDRAMVSLQLLGAVALAALAWAALGRLRELDE